MKKIGLKLQSPLTAIKLHAKVACLCMLLILSMTSFINVSLSYRASHAHASKLALINSLNRIVVAKTIDARTSSWL